MPAKYSLYVKFRPSRTEGAQGSVYYVIVYDKKERNITSGIKGGDKSVLATAKDRIVVDLKTIYCVIHDLLQSGREFTIDDVHRLSSAAILGGNPYAGRLGEVVLTNTEEVRIAGRFAETKPPAGRLTSGMSLLSYTEVLFYRYTANGKRLAKSYRSVSHSLQGFLKGTMVRLDAVDGKFIMDYNAYLESRVSPNTVSFYMRTLRSVLNNAGADGLIDINFDWSAHVNVAVNCLHKDVVAKVLTGSVLQRLSDLDLSDDPHLGFVRDMFMLSFFAHGIELADMTNLRKENVVGNVLRYKRRGVGRDVEVRLGEKAMAIIRKYSEPVGPYLLPIIRNGDRRYQFSSINAIFYKAMQKIGERFDPPEKLSFSMSRRSWQTIIRNTDFAETLIC